MHYIRNYKVVALMVKDFVARGYDPDAMIIAFGSAVRGNYHALSDLDILIVSDRISMDDASVIARIKRDALNDIFAPIEFHIASRVMLDEWYKRFLDVYEIV